MTKIELTPRKQAVLKAIVKAYIETGEPIGSKILTSLIENAPSSATLRNEMSELVSMGLLEQPHTSAGRIPTSDGLKLYINNLMAKSDIIESDKEFIDLHFETINEMPEKIPAKAGEILSDLTGLPVIACLITPDTAVIKSIEILNISRNTVMLLLVTNDSRTRNRMFRLDGLSPQLLERFREIADTKIKGKPLEELTVGFMQNLVASLGIDSFGLLPLFNMVYETANEIENMTVDLSGVSRLYNVCGNEESARRIISLIEQRDPIISLFERVGAGVVFGKDTGFSELQSDTLIAAPFGKNDKYKGYIAVIGPNRISYEKIIPSIEYTAKKLTEVITLAQKEMED